MKNLQNFPTCEECIAKGHPIFKDLTPDELNSLNLRYTNTKIIKI